MGDPLGVDARDYPLQAYLVYALLIGLAGYNYKAEMSVLWDAQSSPSEVMHVALWLVVTAVGPFPAPSKHDSRVCERVLCDHGPTGRF